MKKIHNGYQLLKDYQCFGCAPNNPIGLKMEFFEDGEYIITQWEPSSLYEGYHNVLHGGIQATLMDEIANWVIIHKLKRTGVTNSMEVKYLKSVYLNQGKITVRGKVISEDPKCATVYAEILDFEGTIRSHATVIYTTFPDRIAINKFNFPGYDQFYLEE